MEGIPSKQKITGGRGGHGGQSNKKGGGGGRGEGPQLATEDVQRFSAINGGTGGDGGWGDDEGGVGGLGQGPKFSKQLVSGVEGKTYRVPTLSVGEFCRQYRVSEKIRKLLDEEGFETAASLFEVSDATLKDAGFKSGQIAELKRALKEFLVAATASSGKR
ncbi:hypothetical protein B0H12DRAFT_1106766 [Mycena haematopus]|nr:hypothetical protein B0H12DRAFT_1106766 [Mycena haematopus]